MFPNEVMMKQQTWNDILAAMIAVRETHGWTENGTAEEEDESGVVQVRRFASSLGEEGVQEGDPKTREDQC